MNSNQKLALDKIERAHEEHVRVATRLGNPHTVAMALSLLADFRKTRIDPTKVDALIAAHAERNPSR